MTVKPRLAKIGLLIVVIVLLAVAITVVTKGIFIAEATYTSPSLNDYLIETPTKGGKSEENKSIDWSELRAINPRIVGWVSVEDTPIDYPIVHAPADDPDYYLTHNFYDQENALGTPYLAAGCTNINDSITWIFAHHSLSDRLFSSFSRFSDVGFAKAHPITLYTPCENGATRTTALSTGAVRIVNADVETGVVSSFASNADLLRWYIPLYQKASVQLEEIHLGDKLRAFVTCSYTTFENERTIVFAYEKTTT